LAAGLFALLPSTVDANASRVGNSFNVSPGAPGSLRTDVAYDPANDVYLAVSGGLYPNPVYGRFVKGDGTPLGSIFRVPESAAASQMPKVAYSSDLGGFIVIWQDLRSNPDLSQIWGRYLKYSGGNPAFVTGDFYIDNATGGARSAAAPAVACANGRSECFAVWAQYGGGAEPKDDIHGVRINLAGQLLGNELFITNDNNFQSEPSVAYDAASGTYLAACAVYLGNNGPAEVWIRPVKAGTGEMSATPLSVTTAGTTYITNVVNNPATGQFLVTWYTGDGIRYMGRLYTPDGTAASGPLTLLSSYGGYDAFGIAYNAVSGTYAAVTHGRSSEDIAFQIHANGTPDPEFVATGLGGNGNFNPRVAAHTGRGEWMMTTSATFSFVGGQRIGSTTMEGGGGGNPPPGPPPSETITLAGADIQNGSWFLAEGAANPAANGYRTYYLVENDNPVPIRVRAYFAAENGYTIKKEIDVPAESRSTFDLLGVAGAGSFGSVFQSLGAPGYDIQVERSMYWGPSMEGSTGETATRTPARSWLFAEGSRGGERFANYFLLFNPTQTSATVTPTFYFDNATSFTAPAVTVGPQQRVTIDANSYPQLAGKDFATNLTSTSEVIAERAMYFGWGGQNLWLGGTASMGSTRTNSHWFFAEGAASGGFQTYYLLWNTTANPITVNGRFMTEFGGTVTKSYTIAPLSRRTVELNGEVGAVGGVAAEFWSPDQSQFLAERSSYWGSGGWVEGVNVIGMPGVAPEWLLPEGTTGGLFSTYLLLLNPGPTPVQVDVTLYLEGGAGKFTIPNHTVLQPGSRTTFNMADVLRQLGAPAGSSFATRVKVFGAGAIVAEHAIYWKFDGANYWRAGSASAGIPIGLITVP
jgi:hypothetical protein